MKRPKVVIFEHGRRYHVKRRSSEAALCNATVAELVDKTEAEEKGFTKCRACSDIEGNQ